LISPGREAEVQVSALSLTVKNLSGKAVTMTVRLKDADIYAIRFGEKKAKNDRDQYELDSADIKNEWDHPVGI
jgi:hypothetical protein